MDEKSEEWLSPEEALTRFKHPDVSIVDFPSRSAANKRYGYTLGNMGFLVPDNTLCEVMKEFKVYPVPNTQSWMRGLTNLRGNLIPVYDLSLLLGLSDELMSYDNLLVLDTGSNTLAILVDKLPKTFEVTSWKVLPHSPRLPANLTEYVIETFVVNENIWISFDHRGYFKYIKEQLAI
ncbi:MAG: chemotaxis protein CheW [Gammaproteobacteria bacterium]|nr:chemotaxis protein CheW [Gammaproteobacteria bacterium]